MRWNLTVGLVLVACLTLGVIGVFSFAGCGGAGPDIPPDPSDQDTEVSEVSEVANVDPASANVKVSLPAGSSLDPNLLSAAVGPSGESAGNYDRLVMVFTDASTSKSSAKTGPGSVVMMCYAGSDDNVGVDSESTAIATVLINPLLVGLWGQQRDQFVAAIKAHDDFQDLVVAIETRLKDGSNEIISQSIIE